MKRLTELNSEKLKLVFENNSKLQEKVFNDMFESVRIEEHILKLKIGKNLLTD